VHQVASAVSADARLALVNRRKYSGRQRLHRLDGSELPPVSTTPNRPAAAQEFCAEDGQVLKGSSQYTGCESGFHSDRSKQITGVMDLNHGNGSEIMDDRRREWRSLAGIPEGGS
jgi:hypothetical protein